MAMVVVVVNANFRASRAQCSSTGLGSQKRARPHGTNANSCDGSTKHTLQLSSAASAAAADEAGL